MQINESKARPKTTVTFHIQVELLAAAERWAQANDTTVSELANKALARTLIDEGAFRANESKAFRWTIRGGAFTRCVRRAREKNVPLGKYIRGLVEEDTKHLRPARDDSEDESSNEALT